jgi:hypothetical protein
VVGLGDLQRLTAADLASNMCTVTLSPGFISSVRRLGVNVALSLSWGDGGPVGTPLVWMWAKLTGSTHRLLHGPEPLPAHSRLSMLSAEHQCVLSQLRSRPCFAPLARCRADDQDQ